MPPRWSAEGGLLDGFFDLLARFRNAFISRYRVTIDGGLIDSRIEARKDGDRGFY